MTLKPNNLILATMVGLSVIAPGMAGAASNSTSAAPTFAAFGDMPYHQKEFQVLIHEIYPGLQANGEVGLVINLGDLGRPKHGNPFNACGQAYRYSVLDHWNTLLSNKPVFFTPGDNDWTDCIPARTGMATDDPLASLAEVRNVFHGKPNRLNKTRLFPDYREQPNYPENAMWSYRGMLFVTNHWVGSNNGKVEPGNAVASALNREEAARVAANMAWLNLAATQITGQRYLALVVAMQADAFEGGQLPLGADGNIIDSPIGRCRSNTTYAAMCNALVALAKEKKLPVLLVHGDTNAHCLDQPAADEAPNLWRLNAPGDFMDPTDVDLISFERDKPERPFRVQGLLSKQAPPSLCSAFHQVAFSSAGAQQVTSVNIRSGTRMLKVSLQGREKELATFTVKSSAGVEYCKKGPYRHDAPCTVPVAPGTYTIHVRGETAVFQGQLRYSSFDYTIGDEVAAGKPN